MAQIIGASIDLNKIDKSKVIEGKNGAKYYNITVIVNDDVDQYGKDVAVQTGLTKEERDAKVKATYIGNGKVVWKGTSKQSTVENNNSQVNDDLPF